jgi:hypothetical protein
MDQDRIMKQLANITAARDARSHPLPVPGYPGPSAMSYPRRAEPWRTTGSLERQLQRWLLDGRSCAGTSMDTQVIRVERIEVSDTAQAIIGNISSRALK